MELKSHWLDEYTSADNLSIIEGLSLCHARLGGHEGSKIAALISSRDYKALCNYELPLSTDGWVVHHLIQCRQALGFYQKNPSLDIGVDRRRVALDKFMESERKCSETNDFFFRILAGNLNFLPADARVLYAVRRKIRSVLGVCPSIQDVRLRFGPGATTHTKRVDSCPSTKMVHGLACSQNLHHSGLLPQLLRSVPHWTDQFSTPFEDRDGWDGVDATVTLDCGKLGFVPKNAKTDRTTVTEPVLNGLLQLAYGEVISRRLRKHGIDIRDQTVNQRLAREGSLTNDLATLDLSSASDLISRGLVKFLLPDDWYFMLASCRTGDIRCGKKTISLEKFSSMGNGFTFPLETLIFWAITHVVSGSEASAYGDDIICRSNAADEVIRYLHLCGFSVNTAKSFVWGPFRESCGCDYYMGIETRPFYQKSGITAQTLFALHNFYVRNGDPDMAKEVLRYVHPSLLLYGPDGYGDGHLIGDHPRVLPPKLLKKGYSGYVFDTLSLETRRRTPRYPGDYVSPLYHVYTRGEDQDPLRYLDGDAPSVRFSKAGFPMWALPDGDVVRRITIYTLG